MMKGKVAEGLKTEIREHQNFIYDEKYIKNETSTAQ